MYILYMSTPCVVLNCCKKLKRKPQVMNGKLFQMSEKMEKSNKKM